MNAMRRIKYIPIFPLMILSIISLFALLILCSINSGNFFPWGWKQFEKLFVGVIFLVIGTLIPTKFWKKYAYFGYIFGICLLILVDIAGDSAMGAQRWLNLYFFNLQPSEIMRVLLVCVLAKYFSEIEREGARKTLRLIFPFLLIVLPIGLVCMQPDLGTSLLLFFVGMAIFFVCGVQIWKFVLGLGMVIVSLPIVWNFLHEYQKKRLMMFLSPESDPSGAGYHIIQSKIALGSGGIFGKGLTNGTQCRLNFLPEKQTDFIFAALGEELGFVGCFFLIFLYIVLLKYNLSVAFETRGKFQQIFVFGLNAMLFFYIFINIAMVCGLLPVVGVPLPFFSYGGSALVVLLFCQGCIFSCAIERKMKTYIGKTD